MINDSHGSSRTLTAHWLSEQQVHKMGWCGSFLNPPTYPCNKPMHLVWDHEPPGAQFMEWTHFISLKNHWQIIIGLYFQLRTSHLNSVDALLCHLFFEWPLGVFFFLILACCNALWRRFIFFWSLAEAFLKRQGISARIWFISRVGAQFQIHCKFGYDGSPKFLLK